MSRTRDGIERLLKADGYRVTVPEMNETNRKRPAKAARPDSGGLAGPPREVNVTARRIRESAEVEEECRFGLLYWRDR